MHRYIYLLNFDNVFKWHQVTYEELFHHFGDIVLPTMPAVKTLKLILTAPLHQRSFIWWISIENRWGLRFGQDFQPRLLNIWQQIPPKKINWFPCLWMCNVDVITQMIFLLFPISFLFNPPSPLKSQRGWWSVACQLRVGTCSNPTLPSTSDGRIQVAPLSTAV